MQNYDSVITKENDYKNVYMAVSGYVGEGSERHFFVIFLWGDEKEGLLCR